MTNKEKLIYFQGIKNEFRKSGKISECFYHNKTDCKGAIKQSHSLQRNGRLSIIEGDVNGNKKIYTLSGIVADENTPYATLKPIGKADASTFFGFCDYHDSTLFSPIENFQFDENNTEHLFLHSYRSFAHSYHRKKEELKAYQTDSTYTKFLSLKDRQINIEGCQTAIDDLEIHKKELEKLIDNKGYDHLEYLFHVVPYKIPIACSSLISPHYTYKGHKFNISANPNDHYSGIMLTILPDADQTIIILACFPEDNEAIKFLNELDPLASLPFEKTISSLLINCAENTFFAPALWDALGKEGQKILMHELMIAREIVPNSFYKSKLNLLDEKYSNHRLGIK